MDEVSYQKLKALFPNVNLTSDQERQFRSFWKLRTFKRSELITEAGKTEQYFYFVLAGVQVLYVLNPKDQKVVLGFSYPGNPSGVFDSFVLNRPSSTFLEALKPSQMLAISLENYQKMFDLFPDFHQWGHYFFQDVLIGRLYRELELLTLTAEDRYIEFMRRCPDELKVIPQKYLASYLNMKPETFSRLRSSVRY